MKVYIQVFFIILFFALQPAFAQKISSLKKEVLKEVDGLKPEVDEISEKLWDFSETALLEYKSCELLIGKLESAGFSIEKNVAGMPTAFIASYGSGEPVIGILAEFDALPSVGNSAIPEKKERADGITNGHGCGHNLFGAACVSSAIAIRKVMETKKIKGTLRLYGCPAEETVIGKVYMAKAGLFDDLDGALHWHPGTENSAWNATGSAMNNFEIEFFGKSSHSARDPWNGRSALDALEMLNFGVNQMREHVEPTARIHYVITNGGVAPNVVPNYTKVWYFARDIDRPRVESHYSRILKIAEGAAMATETEFKVKLITGVHEVLPNLPLLKEVQKNMDAIGAISYTDEELKWAKELQKNSGKEEKGIKGEVRPLESEVPAEKGGGSTDVAEVSYITPTSGFRATTAPYGIPWHSWQAASSHGTTIGRKGAFYATKILAMTGIEMFTNPELMEAAKKDFLERTGGKPYKCPIPENQQPPIPEQKNP
ncbi:amidohydrolase [Flexithrix dorotheae]|uniref:amidohydrolase n=1 Tax=Flexithrix dorotheae TaxID=70993 RepID=UPI00035F2CDB|nr:amidohydrolase [Flexithrix dorotheae]